MTTDARTPVARLERLAWCDTLDAVGPDAPTLCDPWRTRDLAAHFVVRERRPDAAAGIWLPPLSRWTEHEQDRIARGDWPALVETIRTGPPWWSPARAERVDALFNTVEIVVHHEDVLRGDEAVGPRREVPERTARAVLSALRKSASLMVRRSPVGVRLVAPGHAPVVAGAEDRVVTATGEPVELLLLAMGRIRVAAVELDGSPEDVAALRAAHLGVS
ncbi:TIGR03085 family metal-binding protein [Oryzobacter telluris]|uniref:TIGR03085 family metal-binding protein n=1 Tax=Oryzobacter telluris TaxID=3149179 RepID=UPI00370D38C6